jgi:hypothetical protein
MFVEAVVPLATVISKSPLESSVIPKPEGIEDETAVASFNDFIVVVGLTNTSG